MSTCARHPQCDFARTACVITGFGTETTMMGFARLIPCGCQIVSIIIMETGNGDGIYMGENDT